jgi:hypothetical protein
MLCRWHLKVANLDSVPTIEIEGTDYRTGRLGETGHALEARAARLPSHCRPDGMAT